MATTPQIRLATEADAAGCLAIYKPIVEQTAISFEIQPPSLLEFKSRITKTLEKTPWLVMEREGAVLGYAYASAHRVREAYQWSTEVTVYIHPQHHRKGYARQLYLTLFRLLRLQGYKMALAGITLPNEASVTFHESMGFKKVGTYHHIGFKLGKWRDTGWWELDLQPGDLQVKELVALWKAKQLPEWRKIFEQR